MVNGVVFIIEGGVRVESKHPRTDAKLAELNKYLKEGTLRLGDIKVIGLETM